MNRQPKSVILCHSVKAFYGKEKKAENIFFFLKIAGILLGPSAFGNIPGFTKTFFPPESHSILNVMANVGLIFFMFLV